MNVGDIVRVQGSVECYTRTGPMQSRCFSSGCLFRVHKVYEVGGGTMFNNAIYVRLVSLDGVWISNNSIDAKQLTTLSPLEQLAEAAE